VLAPGIGVITDGEVHAGVEVRVGGTVGFEPSTSNAIGERRLNIVVAQGAGDPAISQLCDPADGCLGGAPEQNWDLYWGSTNGRVIA
jgi:hypothetical protein